MMLDLLSIARQKNCFTNSQMVAKTMAGESITWERIQQRVDRACAGLSLIAEQNIALYHTDAVEFLVNLLSIWRAGKTAVIPANTVDVMIDALNQHTSTFIGEFATQINLETNEISTGETLAEPPALIMFTSGSTGVPAPVTKSFAQLNAELQMLEHHWGASVEESLFVGTVSHHHMYGLPFRLLWPLVCNRPIVSRELGYLEQLLNFAPQALTLISSPAHLENLPATMDWTLFNGNLKAVFSAGAALNFDAAIRVQEEIGVEATEIYGSTETGAVAHRNQLDKTSWQPLQGISVRDEIGRLVINSPAVDASSWLVTDDLCVVVDDNQFNLTGRVDRIIKVGGKRVSATTIENGLEANPWVKEAKVGLLPRRKSRMGAVVKLTTEGSAQLVDNDKRSFCQALSASLEPYVEQIALPRYWRFVPQMPVNNQGKTTAVEFEALFDNVERPKLPHLLSEGSGADINQTIVLFVPADLIFFDGHFPGTPVLPGIVQVSWAIHFGRQLFGNLGDFRRLERLKFQSVIQPEETISLKLTWDEQSRRLEFAHSNGTLSCSSGRIVFARVN